MWLCVFSGNFIAGASSITLFIIFLYSNRVFSLMILESEAFFMCFAFCEKWCCSSHTVNMIYRFIRWNKKNGNEMKWKEQNHYYIIIVVRLFLLLFHSFRLITIIIAWMDEKMLCWSQFDFSKRRKSEFVQKTTDKTRVLNTLTFTNQPHTHIAQTHPFNIYRIKNRKDIVVWK